jgi:hypothetical protein
MRECVLQVIKGIAMEESLKVLSGMAKTPS